MGLGRCNWLQHAVNVYWWFCLWSLCSNPVFRVPQSKSNTNHRAHHLLCKEMAGSTRSLWLYRWTCSGPTKGTTVASLLKLTCRAHNQSHWNSNKTLSQVPLSPGFILKISKREKQGLAKAWGQRKKGEERRENISNGSMRVLVKKKIISDNPKEGNKGGNNQESFGLNDFFFFFGQICLKTQLWPWRQLPFLTPYITPKPSGMLIVSS